MSKIDRQILILEDERDHSEILKRSFDSADSSDYDFHLNIVSSLEQARRFLKDKSPDLIITDLVLPDGEGTELLSEQESAPDCPVMLMTAHGDEQQAVDAMKAGAMDYVIKSSTSLLNMPAFAERVLQQWQKLLEHKKSQQELRKSEYEKSLIFATVSELIVYLDKEMNILLVNQAAADALGMEVADIEGQRCYRLWHNRDRPCRDCPVVRSFNSGSPEEGEVTGPDERCWFIKANPVKDKKGEITGAVEIAEEITEQKKAREKLLAYQQKLQSLGSKLLLAEERERRRIAVNIHDDIGQNLALSKLTLQSLEQSTENKRMKAALEEVCTVIDRIISQTRTLTFDLSSPVLYELGFEAAVESWISERIQGRYDINCRFEAESSDTPIADEIKIVLFRAVKETLVNVVKHSQADNLWVKIRKNKDWIKVEISDDGIGFDADEKLSSFSGKENKSFGLFNIKEKLEYFGGKLEIDSQPGKGTYVVLSAPVARNVE